MQLVVIIFSQNEIPDILKLEQDIIKQGWSYVKIFQPIKLDEHEEILCLAEGSVVTVEIY